MGRNRLTDQAGVKTPVVALSGRGDSGASSLIAGETTTLAAPAVTGTATYVIASINTREGQ